MDLFTLKVIGCGVLVFAAVILSLTHSHKHHHHRNGEKPNRHHRFRKYLNRKKND